MKTLIKALVFVVVFSVAASYLPFSLKFDATFYNTLFTILGIFYSIGYSIALSFNYSKIENIDFAMRIRKEVRSIIKRFTCCLIISTILFLLSNLLFLGDKPILIELQKGFFKISFQILFAVSMLYCLMHLVYNFARFQKLKDDLEDKVRKDNEK